MSRKQRAPRSGARVLRGRFARRRVRLQDPRAFTHWRTPPDGGRRLQALRRALEPVELLAEPRWRQAASGDPAAAVAIAIDCVVTKELAGLRRDLILSALWGCASAGDPASILVLAALRERIVRRERA